MAEHAGKPFAQDLTWEISSVPGSDRVGQGRQRRNPAVYADEKSDTPIVPGKRPNNGDHPAEDVEGRGLAKGNAGEARTPDTEPGSRVDGSPRRTQGSSRRLGR